MSLSLGKNSDTTRETLKVGMAEYDYFSIATAEKRGLGNFSKIPASLAVVLENLLRFYDESTVKSEDIKAFSDWCDLSGKTQGNYVSPRSRTDAGFYRSSCNSRLGCNA